MNFEKDSVPVLVAELKDNRGNTLRIAMAQLEEVTAKLQFMLFQKNCSEKSEMHY